MRISHFLMAAAVVGFSATGAMASPANEPPPTGAILDLGGLETGQAAQSINHGAPVTESVTFIAGIANTDITLAFREDPAYISMSNVSLVDNTTSSGNLILDGNFASGLGAWTYVNAYGAAAGGVVASCDAFGGANCWYDGAVQAYDAIDQVVATNIGDSYTLSFDYSDNGHYSTFSDLSTNGNTTGTGGNGVDILAYAQAGLPNACTNPNGCTTSTPVPEPFSLSLLGAGLAGAAAMRRRKAKA